MTEEEIKQEELRIKQEDLRIKDEDLKLKKRSLLISQLTPLITILALIFGGFQFFIQQNNLIKQQRNLNFQQQQLAIKNDSLNFRRRLLENQLEVAVKLSEVAGEVYASGAKDEKNFQEALQKYEALYGGLSLLIPDSTLSNALYNLHIGAYQYNTGRNFPKDSLRKMAMQIPIACRVAISKSWKTLPY